MNLDHFGMDSITLAGPLEAKLRAIRAAGFSQVMMNAGDIVGHPDGEEAAVARVRESGLRLTGFQVLRDFEGLSGHLHAYKVDVAKAMLSMCRALGAEIVVAVDLSWGKLGPYRRSKEREVAPREEPSWLGRLKPRWAQSTAKRDDPSIVKQEEPSIPSIFNVFMTSLDIVEMRVARGRLAGEPADVLVTPLLPDFATMDFHRAREAIDEGRAAVERMGPLLTQVLG